MKAIGSKTELWRNTSTPARIALVRELGEITSTRDLVDATTYEDDYRSNIAGLKDSGEFSLTLIFDQTDDAQAQFVTDFESGDLTDYEIRFPTANADIASFSGIISNIGVAMPMEDLIVRTVAIKVEGPIEWGTNSAMAINVND